MTQDARSEPRSVEAVPAESTDPEVKKTPEPFARARKETREAAYEKLALERLTIEEAAPEEPAPTPEPERKPEKEPEQSVRTGVASVSVLPGLSRKAPKPKLLLEKLPSRRLRSEGPRSKRPRAENPREKAPKAPRPPAAVEERKPRDTKPSLSIPRLRIESVTIGDSPDQSYLDREGIIHLSETGFPYERGSNTYIVGHAADYGASRIPNVFRNLKGLQQEDLITLRDALAEPTTTAPTSTLSSTPRTSGSLSLSPARRSSRSRLASPPPPSTNASKSGRSE